MEKVVEISSGNLHNVTQVLMAQVVILGALVYGGMYILRRRANRQLALADGPSIAARETVLRESTKLDLIVAREMAQVDLSSDSAFRGAPEACSAQWRTSDDRK
jgi:hypothetical protein